MKALLIYPKYPDTFWSFRDVLKYIKKKAAFPPLGLLTVAAMLPNEWDKKLIDVNVSGLRDEDIVWADIIFIGAMIVQKENAQEIIKRCKNFNKTVVAGGPLFTTQSEKFKDIDHFVLNEAEATLPLFLEDFKHGKAKQVYSSSERPNITETPIPLWSLINFRDYATMAIQYSRGCPFNCEFCDIIIMNGRIPRTKTPKQILAELESLYLAGWRRGVFIVDDNFIGNKTKVKEMLRELIKWQKGRNFPFRLFTEASINLAEDKELLQLMSAANFHKVFIGIETTNIESLKECGKIQNLKVDLGEAVETIHQCGIQVMAGFIVGFDHDTESVFAAQQKFIQKVGIVTAMTGILTALPQTRLWHRLKDEGRLLSEAIGDNTTALSLNFVPKMGKEKLITGYKEFLLEIYSPKCYYRRINTFVKNYRPTVRGKITCQDIKAFLRSNWRIGLFSKSCFYYWKLIFKTCFIKIKALPLAVELAIYGQHFGKLAKKIANQ